MEGAAQVGAGAGYHPGGSEASLQFDLAPPEIEDWMGHAKAGLENALRAEPMDVRQQYERQLKGLQATCGEAMLELRAREKLRSLLGRTRVDLLDPAGTEGRCYKVSISKLYRWFDVPRWTVYYRSTKTQPKVWPELAEPIKTLIEDEPSFGSRTVAALLGMNRRAVQRIFQLMGWQVRKRAVDQCPRIQALPLVALAPDQRWATDLCRVWGDLDGWLTLALVIDCYSRQLLGWRVPGPFLLRSENGLVYTGRNRARLVRSYGLKQEFITPHCPSRTGWWSGSSGR